MAGVPRSLGDTVVVSRIAGTLRREEDTEGRLDFGERVLYSAARLIALQCTYSLNVLISIDPACLCPGFLPSFAMHAAWI